MLSDASTANNKTNRFMFSKFQIIINNNLRI